MEKPTAHVLTFWHDMAEYQDLLHFHESNNNKNNNNNNNLALVNGSSLSQDVVQVLECASKIRGFFFTLNIPDMQG